MKTPILIFLFVCLTIFNFTLAAVSKTDSLDYVLYNTVLSIKDTTASYALQQTEKLLKQGANPNATLIISSQVKKLGAYIPIVKDFYRHKYRTYLDETTPMHAGVLSHSTKMMALLLKYGGKTNILDKDKMSPLNLALKQEDLPMVDFMLNHGADISNLDLECLTTTSLIKTYVNKGANPKTIDINYALGNTTVLKQLFDLGADPNAHPLDFEKLLKTPGLLDFLLKNGFNVNSIGRFPENSPLIFAAIKYAPVDILKKIVKHGADIFATDSYGSSTALDVAVEYEKIDAVKFLLNAGCSANETDWTKEPILLKAINTDNDAVIQALINKGADIEFINSFGQTPLMKAVTGNEYIAVKTLVENDANVNVSNNYGETPLILAVEKKSLPIIKYLIAHGAEYKILYQDKNIVDFAKSENCSPAIISYLESLK